LREIKGLGGLGLSTAKMQAINKLGYGAISKLAVATAGPLRDAMAPALDGRLWSDRGFQCVWDGGITQSREGGVLINMFGGAAAMGEETAALHTLQTGLEALAPELASTLIPNLRASFFWPRHPYTKGSRATCLPGQYTSLLEHAAAPELDGRVVFAGEHTSPEHHGSINGAVAARQRAARELLAINS
jgi:monoamine oxidase